MKLKKFSAAALAALTVTMMSAAPVLAADDIEVNEDISVSGDYDWKRFANDHITLNVYNNGLYISDGSDESINVLSAFEELTGIKVNYTTYDSNESLYAKLKSGGVSYDVIFPSDYMVGKMAKEGMLSELNMDNIPNFAGIGETYLDRSFDPGNKYSVPYMWGTTGLIYNTTMVEEPPTKWADMWDVAYTNNVLMFNNSRALLCGRCHHDDRRKPRPCFRPPGGRRQLLHRQHVHSGQRQAPGGCRNVHQLPV